MLPLDGRKKTDWYTLRSMMQTDDENWIAFEALGVELGIESAEIRNEWFSPHL